MTYPQQFNPQFPQQPQQGYPAPQQFQQPPAPQYPPQQFGPQQPSYGPQQGFGMPPGYGPQGIPPQGPPMPQGSLDEFFNQPSSGGGPALKFPNVGDAYICVVPRQVTDADVQPQTQPNSNIPATFRDGRQKWVLQIPVLTTPSEKIPDGQARWYVQGGSRDELVRAMQQAGAPKPGQPERGSIVTVQLTGKRASGPGLNPSSVFAVQYFRPGDSNALQMAAQFGIAVPPDLMSAQPGVAEPAPAPAAPVQAPEPQQQVPMQQPTPQYNQAPSPVQEQFQPAFSPPQNGQQFAQPPAPQYQQATQGPVDFSQQQFQPPAPQVAPQQAQQFAQPPAPGPMPSDPNKQALLSQLLQQQQ